MSEGLTLLLAVEQWMGRVAGDVGQGWKVNAGSGVVALVALVLLLWCWRWRLARIIGAVT